MRFTGDSSQREGPKMDPFLDPNQSGKWSKNDQEKMDITGDNSQRQGPKSDQFWTFPENDPKMIPEKIDFTGDNSQRQGPKSEPFWDISRTWS